MKIEIRKIIFFSSSLSTFSRTQISIRFRRFIPEYTKFLILHNAREICCFNKMLINVADLNLTAFEFPFIYLFR